MIFYTVKVKSRIMITDAEWGKNALIENLTSYLAALHYFIEFSSVPGVKTTW